jgi:hypothetical protein
MSITITAARFQRLEAPAELIFKGRSCHDQTTLNGETRASIMKEWLILAWFICSISGSASAGSRLSASYSVPADSTGAAGTRQQSLDYRLDGSAIGGTGVGENPVIVTENYIRKPGYVGQLYHLVGLKITAEPNAINERATRQLKAAPQADDNTTLAALDPSTVKWSIVRGPLTSISSSGLATADTVYQDSFAVVAASADNLDGQLKLTVLNVTKDDFGAYANDQIDDDWQVQYFGQPPNPLAAPDADADQTGQTNLFKFMAGLNPLDGSRFTVDIQPVPGQFGQMNVIFTPIAEGRTYVVQYQQAAANQAWNPLTNTTQSDNGSKRTVTDLGATNLSKFYRVQISKP